MLYFMLVHKCVHEIAAVWSMLGSAPALVAVDSIVMAVVPVQENGPRLRLLLPTVL